MKATDLKFYLSGATSNGGVQANPNLSLGNYRSSTQLKNYKSATPTTNVTGVVFTATGVGAGNPAGAGTLTFTKATNELQWTPPGGTIGQAVAFSGNATKILYGTQGSDTTSGFVGVTVTFASLPATNQTDSITISDHLDLVNSLYDNVSSAEASAGDTEYRAFYIRNEHATESLDVAKIFIKAQTPSPDDSIEFAVEDPSNRTTGFVQTIANEDTAPIGLTWSTVSTEGAALAIAGAANLAAGEMTAIWIKRIVTAGAGAYANNNYEIMVFGDVASVEN